MLAQSHHHTSAMMAHSTLHWEEDSSRAGRQQLMIYAQARQEQPSQTAHTDELTDRQMLISPRAW